MCTVIDMQPGQVVYQSSVRETQTMAVTEGCAPFGESKPSAYSDFLPPTPQRISPSTTHPRRPGTCVTYNWFINNVNRCFWSSLASCQLASVLVYCHRPADCIPLNVRWHKMEKGDFFLFFIYFFILKRMKINCTFSESCMMFMLIDS